MRIKEIVLKNFRCYQDLKIDLDEKYTVLIGSNGAGKSTILDAISISLGGYISSFDRLYGILKDDSHYKMYELGSKIEREHQFPVEIKINTEIEDKKIRWQRELRSEKGRTANKDIQDISNYAKEIKARVQSGDKTLILPLIAYYGTGRLWMQKRGKSSSKKNERFSRLKGYVDCLSSASNEKLMLKWFEDMTYLELQEQKRIPELEVVKKAMSQCYKSINENIDNVNFIFSMKSKELEIIIKHKNGSVENLPLRLLSDGVRSTLSMFADIAYRMAVLNPQLLEEIKDKTPGIILIDEIDMHLHPEWQSKIIKDLHEVFPEIQFIFTTHSPTILANVYAKHIRVVSKDGVTTPTQTTYGREINTILCQIMDTDVKPKEITEKIEKIDDLIDDGELEKASIKIEELRNILGDTDDNIVRATISLDLERKLGSKL